MKDMNVIVVLKRLHATPLCTLANFRDLAPMDSPTTSSWAPRFAEHPLATLIRWGLVDAHMGLMPVTADELIHMAFDENVWSVEFSLSEMILQLEGALDREI